MAERFQKLFLLKDNLYIENASIIISAGALLKDTESGNVIAQIKLKSVSEKNIKGVKISLLAYDVSAKEIKGVEEYQYLDLNISNGQNFGSNKAIVMPETTTRSFAIKSITVIFTDSSVWEIASPEFVIIPESKTLNSEFQNEELVKQYKISTTEKAAYIPNTFLNLWTCCCGEINSGDYCTNCRTSKDDAFSKYNIADLTEDMNLRLAKEKEEQLELERKKEVEKKNKEDRKKKNKKIAAIFVSILSLFFAIILIFNFVIMPNQKYKTAIKSYENNDFDEAIAVFIELGNYKNSKEKIIDCYSEKYEVDKEKISSSIDMPYLKIEDSSISKNGTIPNEVILPSVFDGQLVTTIDWEAFKDCGNLTSIVIPDSVVEICGSAFEGCTNLEKISIPNNITEIDFSVFENCSNLKSIVLPDTLTTIESSAFSGCKSIKNFSLPNGITSINTFSFENCTSIKSIVIPVGIKNIPNFAFQCCSNLNNITISNAVTEIGAYSFIGCDIKNITFNGTKAQWKAIKKGTDWNLGSDVYVVSCTDGNITEKGISY